MDKQTLSNYGWVIVVVLVLAVMLGLATPFGKYVGVGIGNIAKAYKEASNADAIDNNVDTMRDEWNEYFGNKPNLNHSGTIPAGAKYYASAQLCYQCHNTYGAIGVNCSDCGTPFTGGTEMTKFPSKSSDGDVYAYGDYYYFYGTKCDGTNDGWQVFLNLSVTDKLQTSYSSLLESINNEPLIRACSLFSNCTKLTQPPAMPHTVTDMYVTFENCTSLVDMSNYVIPHNNTYISCLFVGCTSLEKAPVIPNGINPDMGGTFAICTSLIEEPEIPTYVTSSKNAIFSGCTQFGYQ